MTSWPVAPVPRPRFFDDIVSLILDASDDWWPCDLCRLARVSHAWLNPVRRRLYSHPSTTSFTSCTQLSQSFHANPYLRSLVHGLELKPVSLDASQATSEVFSALRFLLSLEGLEKLSLGGELAIEAERFIGYLGNSESIIDLSIDGVLLADSFSSPASLEWDDLVAFRFPNLEVLKLSHLEFDISYATSPPPFALRELSFNNVVLIGGSIQRLLKLSKLPMLSISMSDGWDCTPNQIQSILAHCSVESFCLEARGITSQWQGFFDAALPPCPSLQDLLLDEVYLDYDGIMSVSEHCPFLRKLDVAGRSVRVPPPQWARLIKSGAFSQLEHLRLPWFTYDGPSVAPWTDVDALELRDACASRNIVLVS